MKNKKMTYVLGLLTLMVWGIIIYRIFATINHNGNEEVIAQNSPVIKEPYNDYALKHDTSQLSLHYRDPFSLVPLKDTIVKLQPRLSLKPVNAKPAFNWSFIRYSGYIRNPESKKLLAIITINGKNVMLAEGETSGDVKLIRNLKDSIKVSFKNQNKFLVMNTATL